MSITLFKTATANRVLKVVNRILPDTAIGIKHNASSVMFRDALIKITSINDPEDGFYIGSEVIFNKSSKTWVELSEGIKDLPMYETSGSSDGEVGDVVRVKIEPALDENDEVEDNFIGLFTFGGGGSSPQIFARIVSGTAGSYIGNVYDNVEGTGTPIATSVVILAPEISRGTIPSGKTFAGFRVNETTYNIYPATIY